MDKETKSNEKMLVAFATEANQALATVSGANYSNDETLYDVLTGKVVANL